MSNCLISKGEAGAAVPIVPVTKDGLAVALATLPETARGWVAAQGFTGAAGKSCMVPGTDGHLEAVLYGVDETPAGFSFARLQGALPAGAYRIEGTLPGGNSLAVLGFTLAAYRFSRYKAAGGDIARLECPEDVDRAEIERIAAGVTLTRDLINTPANDLGPAELEEAIRALGKDYGAVVTSIEGEALSADPRRRRRQPARAAPRRSCLGR